MDVHADGRTSETYFIRSTQKNRPKNALIYRHVKRQRLGLSDPLKSTAPSAFHFSDAAFCQSSLTTCSPSNYDRFPPYSTVARTSTTIHVRLYTVTTASQSGDSRLGGGRRSLYIHCTGLCVSL